MVQKDSVLTTWSFYDLFLTPIVELFQAPVSDFGGEP